MSQKGCEKSKTLSKILFCTPQSSESIPFLFFAQRDTFAKAFSAASFRLQFSSQLHQEKAVGQELEKFRKKNRKITFLNKKKSQARKCVSVCVIIRTYWMYVCLSPCSLTYNARFEPGEKVMGSRVVWQTRVSVGAAAGRMNIIRLEVRRRRREKT